MLHHRLDAFAPMRWMLECPIGLEPRRRLMRHNRLGQSADRLIEPLQHVGTEPRGELAAGQRFQLFDPFDPQLVQRR